MYHRCDSDCCDRRAIVDSLPCSVYYCWNNQSSYIQPNHLDYFGNFNSTSILYNLLLCYV